jgi:hypothetical protein
MGARLTPMQRAMRAKRKAQQAQVKASEEDRKLTEALRRADAHYKIQLGGLVIKAGVDTLDAATLLGSLVLLRERGGDAAFLASITEVGQRAMLRSTTKQSSKAEYLRVAFPAAPGAGVLALLKALDFSWVSDHWEGYAARAELEARVLPVGTSIDVIDPAVPGAATAGIVGGSGVRGGAG